MAQPPPVIATPVAALPTQLDEHGRVRSKCKEREKLEAELLRMSSEQEALYAELEEHKKRALEAELAAEQAIEEARLKLEEQKSEFEERVRAADVDRAGGSLCEHRRQGSQCKKCGGGTICEHGRVRSQCKECGGLVVVDEVVSALHAPNVKDCEWVAQDAPTATPAAAPTAAPAAPRPTAAPEQYVCPITLQLMVDPVITADGFTYERSAIESWLERHSTSPCTGATLAHRVLAPSIALRQLIAEYRSTSELPEPS